MRKEVRALEAWTKMFPVLVYFMWQTETGIHDSPSIRALKISAPTK